MNPILASLSSLVEIAKSTLCRRSTSGDLMLFGSSLPTEEATLIFLPEAAAEVENKIISFSEIVGEVDYEIEFAIPCHMSAPLAANH